MYFAIVLCCFRRSCYKIFFSHFYARSFSTAQRLKTTAWILMDSYPQPRRNPYTSMNFFEEYLRIQTRYSSQKNPFCTMLINLFFKKIRFRKCCKVPIRCRFEYHYFLRLLHSGNQSMNFKFFPSSQVSQKLGGTCSVGYMSSLYVVIIYLLPNQIRK